MKLKLLTLIILFTIGLFAQDRLTIGELTTGDSIITFYSAGKEWVEVFLTDPAATNDTVIAEIKNPIDGSWITLGIKEQSSDNIVTELIPTASVSGKLYIIWMMYPKNIRLRKTDVHNLSEVMEYSIEAKGISR